MTETRGRRKLFWPNRLILRLSDLEISGAGGKPRPETGEKDDYQSSVEIGFLRTGFVGFAALPS